MRRLIDTLTRSKIIQCQSLKNSVCSYLQHVLDLSQFKMDIVHFLAVNYRFVDNEKKLGSKLQNILSKLTARTIDVQSIFGQFILFLGFLTVRKLCVRGNVIVARLRALHKRTTTHKELRQLVKTYLRNRSLQNVSERKTGIS